MKLFNKKIKDERIENIENRFFKETYFIVLAVSFLSILLKRYVFNQDIRHFTAEFLIIAVSLLYYSARKILSGTYWAEVEMNQKKGEMPQTRKNLLGGVLAGVSIAVFFGFRSAIMYGEDGYRVYYFFLVFAGALMIYLPILMLVTTLPDIIGKRASKKLEEDLDEES